MTRWKREMKAWGKREGLAVLILPKRPQDWHVAKLMSQLCSEQIRSDDYQRALDTALLYGMDTVVARPI